MLRQPGDGILTLPSGRSVGYAIYGDPGGAAVLNCHGGLVSGHDAAPADRRAAELGLCLVSPDRPGVGRTDRLPGHGMLPWVAADVVPLLDHLGVDRCAVVGWSEGGQYALAVSAALGERVDRCAVVAGCLPLDDPDTFAGLNPLDRRLAGLARRSPWLLRAYVRATRTLAAVAPGVLLRTALRGAPTAEADAVRAEGRWLPSILREGAAQPRGVVDEYLAMCGPWGFAPRDVAVPVVVFQGGADTLVPPAWGGELARRIPGAELVRFADGGHFIVVTRSAAILGWLATGTVGPP